MHSLQHEVATKATVGQLLTRSCENCVNDAGFQSGMAGAARCPLIEQSLLNLSAAASFPAEWEFAPNGTLSCAAYCSDLDD